MLGMSHMLLLSFGDRACYLKNPYGTSSSEKHFFIVIHFFLKCVSWWESRIQEQGSWFDQRQSWTRLLHLPGMGSSCDECWCGIKMSLCVVGGAEETLTPYGSVSSGKEVVWKRKWNKVGLEMMHCNANLLSLPGSRGRNKNCTSPGSKNRKLKTK